MARGKTKPKGSVAGQTAFSTEFVQIPVGDLSWAEVEKQFGNTEEVFATFNELVTGGYKFSFSYSDANDAVICAMTCRDPESVNNGKTMSSFAVDWYSALVLALYKHVVIAGGNWSVAAAERSGVRFG